jgi:hypothetical protein
MAINPNTNFSAGQILTATNANQWPRGIMGQVVRTAGDITLGTVEADLTGMSITFTAEANRTYKVTVHGQAGKTTAAGNIRVYVKNGATYLLGNITTFAVDTGAAMIICGVITGLSAGSQTIKLTGSAAANASIQAQAPTSTTSPFTFLIEDVGPA